MTKDEALEKKAENARELGLDYEPEPVAWVCHGADGKHDIDFYQDEIDAIPVTTMLYISPPQRTWVGLTYEEVSEIIDAEIGFNSCWGPEETFAKAIEAKLKEKNT